MFGLNKLQALKKQ